ncbi:hypothetical protein Rhe02_42190 [Rhizocola hellebori]|uniref:Sporulation protein n=1 Tax=Rhizocola hellebori TaxID=1392758 RepID=A0A8J3QA60_9ACTN|nr:sporulation protein [Rhizocola hellebori]GIH06152.1 hypothetical protein Rhe02_42190 [Rhizocola hellebori]
MVFKKLLASLGLGGVEADTVLSSQPAAAGGQLSGQVNLRAKSDTDITGITLILVAQGPMGELELDRFHVAGAVRIPSGATQSVPFGVRLPAHTPFTVLFGQNLPGMRLGVRTELAVASGKAKGDFDPLRVEAAAVHEQIIDTLGLIGCRFVRSEIRPGQHAGLNAPAAQAITFYAPIPEGQQPGPHIPLITFTLLGNNDGLTVLAELAARPGMADRHELSAADITRLTNTDGGWSGEVDRWLVNTLDKMAAGQAVPGAGSGAFMQPHAPAPQHGYRQPGHSVPGYAYSGKSHGSYKYSGYHGRPSMAGTLAMGVGGAALGFLGGMMLGDMIGDAFEPDMAGDAMDAAGIEDPGLADAGYDDMGGYDDFGGGDFGGGDFGGGEF